jgi:hypothetical protein
MARATSWSLSNWPSPILGLGYASTGTDLDKKLGMPLVAESAPGLHLLPSFEGGDDVGVEHGKIRSHARKP